MFIDFIVLLMVYVLVYLVWEKCIFPFLGRILANKVYYFTPEYEKMTRIICVNPDESDKALAILVKEAGVEYFGEQRYGEEYLLLSLGKSKKALKKAGIKFKVLRGRSGALLTN